MVENKLENEKWTIKPDPEAQQGRVFQIVSDTVNEWADWEPRSVLKTVNCIHQADDGPLRRATLAAAAPKMLTALKNLIEKAEAAGVDCAEAREAISSATQIDEALLPIIPADQSIWGEDSPEEDEGIKI